MIRNLVVVGIDDSSASRAAMEWAADYARMIDARLKAVHVRPAVEVPHQSQIRPMLTLTDREADERVRDIFYSVNPEPGWTLTTARGSSAADVLIRASEHAVLLVVGSRQMGGLNGLVHHSVSRHVTLHATVPVVVCPDLDGIEARQRIERQAAGAS